MRVVVIPGVCGTEIGVEFWIGQSIYWMSPPILAAYGPSPLRVNDSGTGDYPPKFFKKTLIGPPLHSYYDRLKFHFESLGHAVFMAGYDWRLGVRKASEELWPRIKEWAGNDLVYLIGHSLGGMVGRGILRTATDLHEDGQIVRLLTLGTPQLGSLSIPRLWTRLSWVYNALGTLFFANTVGRDVGFTGNAFSFFSLDQVIGSFVSTYELLPQPNSPELGGGYDYVAAVTRATYGQWGSQLLDARFPAAEDFHFWIENSIYPTKMLTVIGRGIQTPQKVLDVSKLDQEGGYSYDPRGDGVVSEGAATLEGVPKVYAIGVSHSAMPYDSSLLPRLPDLLFTGTG